MTKTQTPKVYNLQERTFEFSKEVLSFVSKLPNDRITNPLVNQLIRSSTSIGANYCEADEASSRKDFTNKVTIAKKEAKETKYWLKLLSHVLSDKKDELERLLKEAQELNLILAAIVRNSLSA